MTPKLFTSSYWRERREDLASLGALLLFFISFFPQGLFGGKYLLAGDSFYYSYPLRSVAWSMIRQGDLPLWTPTLLSGYPLFSMAQLGLAYPLTWGYLFLPGHVAEQIYVLAPYLLAPVFTYAYLRQVNRSPLASLLGALTFGYGGMMASPLANNGLMPNAVMWLPLLLIAIERARYRPFVNCLTGAMAAYAGSVLTGYGQGFLYLGLLAAIYSLLMVAITNDDRPGDFFTRSKSLKQWQPVFVLCGAIIFAVGLASVQLFETARAVKLSVRSTLNYDIFTQGSFRPLELVRSVFQPLFGVVDMTAYVAPLALGLAIFAVSVYWKRRAGSDPRIIFWFAIAVAGFLLMMGAFTPIYRVLYYTPLLNRFRVPSRHAFEWTFGIGVLAAFGWDAAADLLRQRRATNAADKRKLIAAGLLLVTALIVGALWWRQVQTFGTPVAGSGQAIAYLIWKIGFVLLTAGAVLISGKIARRKWRKILLIVTLLVLCFVEPSASVYRWWGHMGQTAERFYTEGLATKFVKQSSPVENRVYTRVALTEQFESQPRFDCANVSAVWGLQNVAGYEPLILDRYSRALGGVGPDSVLRFSAPTPDDSLLGPRSHVLDILNTRYVISYSNLAFIPPRDAGNIKLLPGHRLPTEVQPKSSILLTTPGAEAESLLLVTSLANSVGISQGTVVARVLIHTAKTVIERELRAGVDTAEWAHDRPDVRAIIQHNLAPVYDTHQFDGPPTFPAYRFKSLITFNKPERVTRIEVVNVTETVQLAIYSGALINSQSSAELPSGFGPAENWRPVYEQDQTLILRNERAQPRIWLVAEAHSVDSEEALRRIRGESAARFDPQQTALLEVSQGELPKLPGGLVDEASYARIISSQATRLQIETNAPAATFLVISEIFYPGWVATIDSQPARIYQTNYLLRGISLPPGKHMIEMRYSPRSVRVGGVISGLTLMILAGLLVYAWRARTLQTER